MQNNFLIKIVLFPFYILFYLIVWVRNKLFDNQILKSVSPKIFTINVGNLAVGGTGKTPMVEYLINLFDQKNIAVLSRGYGRETKGFIMADASANPRKIGDEPYQYFLKFGQKHHIFVGENRVEASQRISGLLPKTKVLILDDAFQHRNIKANINIVLTDYNNLIYNDLLMPLGKLREPVENLIRAEIVIVTKCPPNLTLVEANEIEAKLLKNCRPNTPIFFTKIEYGKPIQFNGLAKEMSNEILLITGIAQPQPMLEYCTQNWTVLEHVNKPDHYNYLPKDIEKFSEKVVNNKAILTTEKDFVKLKNRLPDSISAYYLPIYVVFLWEKNEIFNTKILHAFNNFYKQ